MPCSLSQRSLAGSVQDVVQPHTGDSQEVACPEHISCVPFSQGTPGSVCILQVLRGLACATLVWPTRQELHRADEPIVVQTASSHHPWDLKSEVVQTLRGQTVETRIQLEIVIIFRHLDVNRTATCSATSVARSVQLGSIQYRMVHVVESLDQVGMLFLSDLSRQECSTHTTTSQQEFDDPDSPTGHGEEKGFSQTTNTRWRQVTRCVGHEIALLPEYAGKINTCSHLTECAERLNTCSHFTKCGKDGRNKVSYFAEYADGPNKGFCTPRSAQENLFSAEFTKRGRCDIPG